MRDNGWVEAATADVSLVAELLLNLHHFPPPPPSSPFPLKWSVRQPRSRSLALKTGIARASPTTPLSWTGGSTSQSGGVSAPVPVEGSEESSRPVPGSKVNATNEATPSKRSRKKKTMTELKEEEILVLNEKRELKRTLASLLVNLEKKQSANTNLKRIKMDMASQKANTIGDNGGRDKFVIPDLNVAFVESNTEGPSEMSKN